MEERRLLYYTAEEHHTLEDGRKSGTLASTSHYGNVGDDTNNGHPQKTFITFTNYLARLGIRRDPGHRNNAKLPIFFRRLFHC